MLKHKATERERVKENEKGERERAREGEKERERERNDLFVVSQSFNIPELVSFQNMNWCWQLLPVVEALGGLNQSRTSAEPVRIWSSKHPLCESWTTCSPPPVVMKRNWVSSGQSAGFVNFIHAYNQGSTDTTTRYQLVSQLIPGDSITAPITVVEFVFVFKWNDWLDVINVWTKVPASRGQ